MKRIGLADPAWSWSRDSEPELDVDIGSVRWSCTHGSDYWRLTSSGSVSHNGHAFTVPVSGDFAIEGRFSAELAARYDQLGLVAIDAPNRWLKAGFELDGQVFVGAVHTRDDSDWSLQPGALPGWLRLTRSGGTVEVLHRPAGSDWRVIRQLTLDGPIAVGCYAAAPTGPGFRASVEALSLAVEG